MLNIIDVRMHDGRRNFGNLPETVSVTERDMKRLLVHVRSLPGTKLGEVVTDNLTEAWIDFEHDGHRFTMNNQFGDWWFFVADPTCPDEILHAVLAHFSILLAQG